MGEPFWRTKPLEAMTPQEWESLCDGCGRCCLNKLEDWDTGDIYFTSLACAQLDTDKCRCRNYERRLELVPDCVNLTPQSVREITWLPPSCAYRLVAEGRELYAWHHLVCGDRNAVHEAGVSVRGRVFSEEGVALEEYENFLVSWPCEEIRKPE